MTLTEFQPGRTYAVVRKPIDNGGHVEPHSEEVEVRDDQGEVVGTKVVEWEEHVVHQSLPGDIIDVTDWPQGIVVANENQGRIEVLPGNPLALEHLAQTMRMAPDIVEHPSQAEPPPKEQVDGEGKERRGPAKPNRRGT